MLSSESDIAIFIGAGFRKLMAQLFQFLQQIVALGLELLGFQFQTARVSAGEPFGDGADGALQLLAAVQIAFQDTDAQRAQFRNNVMADHAQGFGRMAGDQDTLSLRQQMANEISDGVSFARSGRALH